MTLAVICETFCHTSSSNTYHVDMPDRLRLLDREDSPMKCWAVQLSVTLLLLASSASFAQDNPQDGAARVLIEQLGNDEFKKREEAEERLIEMGSAAIEALRAATKSADSEIVFRAQRALKRITELSPAEQEDLRKAGQ